MMLLRLLIRNSLDRKAKADFVPTLVYKLNPSCSCTRMFKKLNLLPSQHHRHFTIPSRAEGGGKKLSC
jgi:hypothetical protein